MTVSWEGVQNISQHRQPSHRASMATAATIAIVFVTPICTVDRGGASASTSPVFALTGEEKRDQRDDAVIASLTLSDIPRMTPRSERAK
jgi:hypothetical protein